MAATDLEKLVVQLSADVTKFNNAMNKVIGQTNKQVRVIENRFSKMNKGIGESFAGFAGKAAAALATIGGTSAAIKIVDTATKIQNALKVAGLSGTELKAVYESLYTAAQKNGVPVEALAVLYGKAAQAQKELGATTLDLTGFTNNVALALRVAGTDATAASGALLQLGQALGSGTVHAEEFNSVLEGAPTIVQAVAAGLKEAGGSVAQLKALVIDGKISSEAFFRAFEAGAPVLEQMAKGSTLTIAQQFTQLQNAIVDAAGKMDTATGASSKLGAEIQELAGYITALGNAFTRMANSDIGAFIGKIYEAYAAAKELKNFLGGWGSTFSFMNQTLNDAMTGKPIGQTALKTANTANQDYAQSRINDAFSADPKTGRIQAAPVAVKPVSIKDFKPPVSKAKSGGGSKKESDYAREIEKITERTAVIQAETDAQKCVCGSIFILEEF